MSAPKTTTSNNAKRASAAGQARQRKQLALVGILGGGLVIALLTQPSKKTTAPSSVPSTALKLNTVSLTTRDDDSDQPLQPFVQIQQLPSLNPSQLTSADLFRVPYVPPPKEEVVEEELPPTKEFVVGAVYGDFESNLHSALIDGEIVREGENLEGGVKVLAVSERGINVSQ